jgi:hypothetical protein
MVAVCRDDGAVAGAAAIAFDEWAGIREVFIITSGGRYDMGNDISF